MYPGLTDTDIRVADFRRREDRARCARYQAVKVAGAPKRGGAPAPVQWLAAAIAWRPAFAHRAVPSTADTGIGR